MIREAENTAIVAGLFDGWQETLIYSCLQKVMGRILVTDLENPESAMASVGCFAFVAGKPDRELVLAKPEGFVIMVPQNEAWASLILRCLEEGLYPSWDAHNMDSVRLAEKLGYEFDHQYPAYELSSQERTH